MAEPRRHPRGIPGDPVSPRISSFARHAVNQATELPITFKAYQALEVDGEVLPSRSELGALLHTLTPKCSGRSASWRTPPPCCRRRWRRGSRRPDVTPAAAT